MCVSEVVTIPDRAATWGVESVRRHGRVCPPYDNGYGHISGPVKTPSWLYKYDATKVGKKI